MEFHKDDLSLDPEDWQEARRLAHRMVDDGFDYLQTLRRRPVWQPVPREIAATFSEPLPWQGQRAEAVYEQFLERVLPYPMGNIHPRFWGWYMGSGTVSGALADFLAAMMNPNLGGGYHAAALVEGQVIDWCKELLGYPPEASGLLVSGGSMANFIGLTVARNVQFEGDVRKDGMMGAVRPLVFYGSVEVHSSNQKALELLGVGSKHLRQLPVDSLYCIDLERLQEQIAADREAGLQPACVIGSAGTINTGAVDDLNALAEICARDGLWFHVDGAIGAAAAASMKNRALIAGIEKADSIALDLHKWLHMPFEAGCALVRSEPQHRQAFSLTPEYLEHAERGLHGGATWFSDYGLQLSRGFRALKVWMGFKEHGLERFGRQIDRNIEQAHYLAALIESSGELQLMAPVGLDIVCFRYEPGGLDLEALNRLNRELLLRIHEDGIAIVSYTTLDGVYCLRAAISNHRTLDEDVDLFVRRTLELGRELVAEGYLTA